MHASRQIAKRNSQPLRGSLRGRRRARARRGVCRASPAPAHLGPLRGSPLPLRAQLLDALKLAPLLFLHVQRPTQLVVVPGRSGELNYLRRATDARGEHAWVEGPHLWLFSPIKSARNSSTAHQASCSRCQSDLFAELVDDPAPASAGPDPASRPARSCISILAFWMHEDGLRGSTAVPRPRETAREKKPCAAWRSPGAKPGARRRC